MYHIHLGSGLPGDKYNSFTRQLLLLKKAIERAGHAVSIGGPDTTPNTDCSAVILLGYPEQFPWLSRHSAKTDSPAGPVFFWAQYSKPPNFPISRGEGSRIDGRDKDNLIYIPLTRKTGRFLEIAGLKNIGPVVPHGVDVAVFYPRKESGRNKDVFTVGTIGAHTLRKQFKSVLESFALFSLGTPRSRLIIKTDNIISRDGEDLSAIAAGLGIGSKVEFNTDNLNETEMAGLYRKMDVYLNLSEWEGFCIPVIEAMACGVSVLAQKGQGPGEIVPYNDLMLTQSIIKEDGGSRLLYAKKEECAAKLDFAARNRHTLNRLSVMGISVISGTYNINHVAGRWLKLVNDFQ